MLRLSRLLFTALVLPLAAAGAWAESWQAQQGDVLRIVTQLPPGKVRVVALATEWPWQRLADGRVLAWVGIDMQTPPGSHQLTWLVDGSSGRWQRRDALQVRKADFPVSHIRVERRMAEFDAATLARIRGDQASLKRTYAMKVAASPDIVMAAMPVAGSISSSFGARRFVNGKARSPHSGIDIATEEGTPIAAPLAGRVLLAKPMYLNGNTVVLGHGRGLVSVYSHLKDLRVHPGQWLATGELLGQVGKTGRVTGAHLHWGVRFKQARVNPVSLLAGNNRE